MARRNTNDPNINFLEEASVPPQNVVDLRTLRAAPQPAKPAKKQRLTNNAIHPKAMAMRFLLVAVLLVIPIAAFQFAHKASSVKGTVLGSSTQAYSSLIQAGIAMQQLDGQLAQKDFADAAAAFAQARKDVNSISSAIDNLRAILPAAGQLKSGRSLLAAGESMAVAGEHLSTMAAPLLAADQQNQPNFPAFLHAAQQNLDPAADSLDQAVQALQDVKPSDLPDQYRSKLQGLTTALPQLSGSVSRFRDTILVVLDLLGASQPKRYLVLLQNNTELRPTGGFIGSVALIDVADGAITKLEVPGGGSYDYQGQLKAHIISPEPLHIVNPAWYLQDANWWPDFPTSAQKIMWFYEKSGGPTVDGVLTLTPDVVVALLQQTGPVELKDPYNITINADNFLSQVQQSTTAQTDKPKQMIADLLPVLLDRLFRDANMDRLALLGTFETALQQKQMLFYFPDAGQEDRIVRLGWGGEIKATDSDYLSVIDTNIGGGKTDGVIDETVEHHATINTDGTVDVAVTIKRTHFGSPDDPLTATRNVDYVRVYVPKGSTLQKVEGFETIDPKRFQAPDSSLVPDETVQHIEGGAVIDAATGTWVGEEFGKTVFANWMGVAPGETAIATIAYRLPFKVQVHKSWFSTQPAKYSVLFQKQPGAKTRQLVSTIAYPRNYILRWLSPDDPATTTKTSGNIITTTSLDTDKLVGLVLDAK